jgi:hypothetical protein
MSWPLPHAFEKHHMGHPIKIENIEEMRLQQGIDDVELRTEIRRLRVGNFVNLTFVSGAGSSETLTVRITKVNGSNFLGKLVEKPRSSNLSEMSADAVVAFRNDQIHSISNKQHVSES